MKVVGYNVTPSNLWDNITNLKRYKGMTQSEFMYQVDEQGHMNYRPYDDFKAGVQEVMSNNYKAIQHLDSVPLGGILNASQSAYQSSVEQVAASMSQWKIGRRLLNGTFDGKAVGWDLETVGDITSRTYDGYAGITEIGIVERVYKAGERILSPDNPVGYSLAVGFDDNQVKALRQLVEDYKKNGWDSLADPNQMPGRLSSKQSTLQRLSMLGSEVVTDRNGQTIIAKANKTTRLQKTQVPMLGNKSFNVWQNMGPANFDPALMMHGINLGAEAYKAGATPQAVLPDVMQYFTDITNSNTDFLYGANAQFDATSITNIAEQAGILTSEGARQVHDVLYNNTVDIVYGTRNIASAKAQSVNTMSQSLHKGKATDINAAATVESQAEILQIGREQVHFSVDDIVNEGDILMTKLFEGKKSYIDTVIDSAYDIEKKSYSTDKTMFLLNRGNVKNDSSDLVVVHGETSMQTYPMGNEYWTLGTHNGYTTVEDGYGATQERYIVEFVNGADKDIQIYKSFDTIDDAQEYIYKNTTFLEAGNISGKQVRQQHMMHVRDMGRREFEKLFDVKEVYTNNGQDEGGFVRLKQYVELAEELDADPTFKDKSLRPILIEKLRQSEKATSVLKSEYQIQAFAGMFEKLSDERKIYDDIIDAVDNVDGNNITKTSMAQQARQYVINAIENIEEDGHAKYQLYTSDGSYSLSDVFGVDIEVDGKIKRINASSVDSAVSGVRNVFKGLDEEQSIEIINSLHQRGVISDDAERALLHSASLNIRPGISNNNFVLDVAHQMAIATTDLREAKNPFDEFGQMVSSNGELPAKNLQSIADNLQAGAVTRYRITNGNDRVYKLSTIYDKHNLGAQIPDNIRNITAIPIDFYDTAKDIAGEVNALQQSLGLGEQETNILRDLFLPVQGANGKEYYKPYSIGAHRSEGLQAFILNPESTKSAYLLFTNDKHSTALSNMLIEGVDEKALKTYKDAREVFGKHAAVVELHSINSRELGITVGDLGLEGILGEAGEQIKLSTVNQSENYEKFLVPILDFYKYTNKYDAIPKERVYGAIKTGGEDLYSALRMATGKAIERVLDNDFDMASTMIRRTQNKALKDLSAPSSYRGVLVDGTIKRVANYHPADFIHAFEMNTKGLDALMNIFIESEKDNTIKDMLVTFNNQYQAIAHNPEKSYSKSELQRVFKSTSFNEFYVKNLFNGNVAKDLALETETYGYSIFELLSNAVRDDVTGLFDESVSDTLESFGKTVGRINQILPETAVEHRLISYIKPGEFNVLSGLFSTLRPTYTQQNRPLYFEASENAINLLQSDGYTYVGQSSMSKLEHDIGKFLSDDGLTSPTGARYDSQYRSINTRFKQIGDAQLQKRYLEIENRLTQIAQKTGLDEDKLKSTLQYMRNDMSTLYEGKWFYDPLLGNQDFFKIPDAKKVTLFTDETKVNLEATRKKLESLENKTITAGDVIGISGNGLPMYYDGPTSILRDYNIEELLKGETYILPSEARVSDIKLMIGSEKAMAHTIDIEKLVASNIAKFGPGDDALAYAHTLFQEMFDGAMVAGTMGTVKHNNNTATYSVWNTIATEYVRAGKGETLVNILTKNDALSSLFKDWNISLGSKGNILVDNAGSLHLTDAVAKLEEQISLGLLGDEDVNKRIVESLKYQRENNIITGDVQRVHINEHLSNHFILDQRIEQGIRNRTRDASDGLSKTVDEYYLESLKKYAMSDSLGESDFLERYDSINAIANYINKNKMADTRAYNKAVKNNRRNVIGIKQSLQHIADPTRLDLETANVLQIKVSDLIKDDRMPKSGASVEDLERFLFFVDGKPSQWLKQQANGKIDWNKSASLYVDFERTVMHGGKAYNGVLIPIQNMISNIDDNQFFTDTQRISTSFLNKIVEISKKPGENSNHDMIKAIENYAEQQAKQMAIMDKNSDMYKAYGKIALPNAGQYQAIDETPALIETSLNADIEKLVAERDELAKRIASGDTSAISQYDLITGKNGTLTKLLEQAADEIRNAGDTLPALTSMKTSRFAPLTTMTINGKSYYNNLVAIGEEGFRTRGYDFGQVGMDVFYNPNSLSTIANKQGFKVTEDDIKIITGKLKEAGIEVDSNNSNPLLAVEKHLQEHYAKDNGKIDIKKVNQAIVDGKMKNIFGAFEDLGKKYTREVGILAEHLRYPSFGSQPLVNVVLDDTIQGMGIRYFNPVMSTYTNVDFDGDTAFLSLIMDGGSIAKANNERFIEALRVHERSVKFNNSLLAELVQKGSAYNVDNLNDYKNLTANMLQAFNGKEYDEALRKWAVNNNIGFRSIKDLSEGQIIAANHSAEMAEAWADAKLNTLLDNGIIRASLAVPTRKLNIGTISTPNWNLRSTIETLSKDKSFTEEQRRTFMDIYEDMSTMKTSERGLTGITEQKGIDVKHVVAGYGIADTPKWAIGMNQMFVMSKNREASRIAGLTNMIKASNAVLFDNATDAQIQEIVKDIITHDRQYFLDHADEDLANAKRYFRGIYDIAHEDKAVAIFNASIKKGKWDDDFRKRLLLEEMYDINSGTLEASFEEAINRAQMDERILMDKNRVYLRPGSIEDGTGTTAWRLVSPNQNGKVVLQELSLDPDNFLKATSNTEKFGNKRATNLEINEELSAFFHGHYRNDSGLSVSYFDAREGGKLYEDARLRAEKITRINILNDVVLDKSGALKTNGPDVLADLQKNQFKVLSSLGDLERWFQISKPKKHAGIYAKIASDIETYQYAVNMDASLTKETRVSSIIRALNEDIVNNPDKYAQMTDFQDYSDLVHAKLESNIGAKAFANAEAHRQIIGDFDIKSYRKVLSELQVYDIINEESRMKSSYEEIQTNLDSLNVERTDASAISSLQGLIDNSDTTIRETLAELEIENKMNIHATQDKIYGLFKNTNQMDAFFKWDKVSSESIVGYGEYIGAKFENLTSGDIKSILADIDGISQDSLKSMSEIQQHALQQTKTALTKYKSNSINTVGSSSKLVRNVVQSDAVSKIVIKNQDTLNKILSSINVDDSVKTAKEASSNMKKQTLHGSLFDSAKSALNKIPMKTVGIAAASLAALGIANNLLHNQKNSSPLSPTRKSSNDSPSMKAPEGYPQQAPLSKSKVVYHDNGSGLNFKVSAKTNNYINEMNNAKLIGMAGGGNASVYSQSDTSGVTDNWLANKFAELA